MTQETSSRSWLRRLRGSNNEGVLLAILLVIVIGMSIASPAFLTVSTLFSLLRSSIVPMIYALAVLMVIISGGIDVSFAAIAAFAGYTTVKVQLAGEFDLGLWGSFLFAILLGVGLGSVNGFFISRFRLPTLIVTLGTQGIFQGVLLAYVGSQYIANLPKGMASASTLTLISAPTETGTTSLHVMVVPAIALVILMMWMLNRTMFGRSIYAIGGDEEAARRAGINVRSVQMRVYVLAGVLAAFAGMLYMIMGRSATPQEMVGNELSIIAAVVLGGASIFGGRGSVTGTVLGVLLVQLINNSLILVGVPTAWQRTAVGLLLIAGVGVQAFTAARASRTRPAILEEDAQ